MGQKGLLNVKALVTGATGFIGRHLTRELLNKGHEVSVAVRNPEKLREAGLERDVCSYVFDLERAPEENLWEFFQRPDIVFHLAWEGLPNYSSFHHIEENLPRHYRFLKGLAQGGCPKILVTGTCAEYGNQSGQLNESAPVFPDNAYAAAKHALYLFSRIMCKRYDTIILWARVFYITGERGRPSLFDDLGRAMRRGDESFDLSGGEQLRDFLNVEEVASSLRKIAEVADQSMVINVGSGSPVSICSVVERIVSLNKSNIRLNWGRLPYADNEPMAFWADVSRLNSLLRTGDVNGSGFGF